MLNMHMIIKTHKSLAEETFPISVMYLAICHLDYSYTLLIGLPKLDVNRMQGVQSFAAKVVFNEVKYLT